MTDFLRTVVLDDLGSQRSRCRFGLSEVVKKNDLRVTEGCLLCDCLLLPRGKMEEAMFDKASKFRLAFCVSIGS